MHCDHMIVFTVCTAVQLHTSCTCAYTNMAICEHPEQSLFVSLDVQHTIWGASVIRRHGRRTCVNSSWIYCMSDLVLIKTRIKAVGRLLQTV